MTHEVRRVPPHWHHPTDRDGEHIPLRNGPDYREECAEWDQGLKNWDPATSKFSQTYEEFQGPRPDASHYMPVWSKSQATHYQMYETITEGTPISPVMDSPAQLARWLAANSDRSTDYAGWLAICKQR